MYYASSKFINFMISKFHFMSSKLTSQNILAFQQVLLFTYPCFLSATSYFLLVPWFSRNLFLSFSLLAALCSTASFFRSIIFPHQLHEPPQSHCFFCDLKKITFSIHVFSLSQLNSHGTWNQLSTAWPVKDLVCIAKLSEVLDQE